MAAPPVHRKAFLTVEPTLLLVVDDLALPRQKDAEPVIAEAPPRGAPEFKVEIEVTAYRGAGRTEQERISVSL